MKNLAPIALAIAVLALSSTTVQADGDHNAPEFSSESTTMSVPENSLVNTVVGRVSAGHSHYPKLDRRLRHQEEDVILYTLKGRDSNSFHIGLFLGTIWTKEVSYESGSEYSVTVRAENGKDEFDEIDVTILVVDEEDHLNVMGEEESSGDSGAGGTSQQERSDDSSDDSGADGDTPQETSDDSSDDQDTGSDTSQEKSDESSDDSGAGGDQASVAEPLTAAFEGLPATHDGETAFTFRLAFSEAIVIGYEAFRDHSVGVSGGAVTKAQRVNKRRDLWEITVEPASDAAVSVSLLQPPACDETGAICTGDGRPLSVSIATIVLGPAQEAEEPDQQEPEEEQPEEEQPQEPPPAPQNLTGVANSDGSITLSWDAPDDDTITGYQILRRRPSLGEDELLIYVADTGSAATSYTDTEATPQVRHAYRVKAINSAGVGNRSNYVNVTAAAAKVVAASSGLAPNFPNPFNSRTLIPYRLATPGAVRLEIYNLLGQSLRTLVDQYQDAGFYKVRWDARDRRGAMVSAGMYLVRLHYPGGVQTKRLLYLK